jgi:hypothetical protein
MGKTVVISSHILADLEEISTEVCLIDHGKAVWAGTLDELARERHGAKLASSVEVREGDAERPAELLAALEGVRVASLRSRSALVARLFVLGGAGFLLASSPVILVLIRENVAAPELAALAGFAPACRRRRAAARVRRSAGGSGARARRRRPCRRRPGSRARRRRRSLSALVERLAGPVYCSLASRRGYG